MKILQDSKLDGSSAPPLFEIARVLVRFNHVARRIVNPNHCIS